MIKCKEGLTFRNPTKDETSRIIREVHETLRKKCLYTVALSINIVALTIAYIFDWISYPVFSFYSVLIVTPWTVILQDYLAFRYIKQNSNYSVAPVSVTCRRCHIVTVEPAVSTATLLVTACNKKFLA